MRQIVELAGVGQVLAAACADKGFRSVEDIAAAKVADLVAVPGVSTIRANQLIQAAQGLLRDASQPPAIRAGDDVAISSADGNSQKGIVSPPAAPVTNGAGDQADFAQSAGDISATSQPAASSTRTDAESRPVVSVKTANAPLEGTGPVHRDDVKTKKKQKTKSAKKKRGEKRHENKKSSVKKSKKKNKNPKSKTEKKSKKNKKNQISKKTKPRQKKKKSGKSK